MPITYNPDYEYIVGNANKGPYSMTFNGIVLDDYITNFVVEDVGGRDSLSSEISELSYGRVDGSLFRYRRHESKDLTVSYTMITNDDSDQRDMMNVLRGILYAPGSENAKIIFADEPDKYYVGSVSNITQEKILYNNTSKGEITIRLNKPYKYAVNPTTVTPQTSDNVTRFLINYEGTRKAYPEITITFPSENVPAGSPVSNDGDCGYVAFVNQNGNIIQLGDPDETDLDSRSTNSTLVNQKFTLWDSTASSNWAVNNAKAKFDTDITKVGSFARQVSFDNSILTAASYGSGEKWHGPSITYTLPSEDITDFTLLFGLVGCTGGNPESARDIITEVGKIRVQVANDDHVLTEFELVKPNKASLDGNVNLYCGEDKEPWWSKSISCKTFNDMFGFKDPNTDPVPLRNVSLEKNSDTYTISLGEEVHSFTINKGDFGPAKYLTVWIGSYGTDHPLSSVGLTDIRFQSNHWATNKQMKNTFTTNDVCKIDCETGEIFLNGASKPSLGAVGNQWEQFALLPGLNQIDINWSSWVETTNKPTFSLTYRKAYV